jgi:DNA helicase IV
MENFRFSEGQIKVIERPIQGNFFLEGLAGSGKTTVGVERMLHLMAQGVRGDTILLLAPQRTLAAPYYEALRHPG